MPGVACDTELEGATLKGGGPPYRLHVKLKGSILAHLRGAGVGNCCGCVGTKLVLQGGIVPSQEMSRYVSA